LPFFLPPLLLAEGEEQLKSSKKKKKKNKTGVFSPQNCKLSVILWKKGTFLSNKNLPLEVQPRVVAWQ